MPVFCVIAVAVMGSLGVEILVTALGLALGHKV